MERTELKLGQYVIGKNNISYQQGRIESIEESTGSRKGLIYKIGINWFFADEIEIDLEGILLEFIHHRGLMELQDPIIINPECGIRKPLVFTYDNEKYTLQGLFASENFVYVVANDRKGKSMFLCTRHIPKKTMQRIFDIADAVYSRHSFWNEINIK
jgi:hypothetical protein